MIRIITLTVLILIKILHWLYTNAVFFVFNKVYLYIAYFWLNNKRLGYKIKLFSELEFC